MDDEVVVGGDGFEPPTDVVWDTRSLALLGPLGVPPREHSVSPDVKPSWSGFPSCPNQVSILDPRLFRPVLLPAELFERLDREPGLTPGWVRACPHCMLSLPFPLVSPPGVEPGTAGCRPAAFPLRHGGGSSGNSQTPTVSDAVRIEASSRGQFVFLPVIDLRVSTLIRMPEDIPGCDSRRSCFMKESNHRGAVIGRLLFH